MSELQSNRRRQAQKELGLTDEHEQAQIEHAMKQEEERKKKKELRRMEIEESSYHSQMDGQVFHRPDTGLHPACRDRRCLDLPIRNTIYLCRSLQGAFIPTDLSCNIQRAP